MQLLYQQPAQTIETLFNYLSEIIYLNVTWIKDGFQKNFILKASEETFCFYTTGNYKFDTYMPPKR